MTLIYLSALAALVSVVSSVEVRSGTDCPSSEEIVARLRPLLPPGGIEPGPADDLALLEIVEPQVDGVTELRLRLLHSDGRAVGDRRLVAEGGCERVADTIATLIAVWETEPPEFSSLKQAAIPGSMPTASPSRTGQPSARFGFALGVSVGAALVGGISATGGVEAIFGARLSPWKVRLAGLIEGTRDSGLAGGTVSWRHTTAAAGVMLRSRGAAWHFAVDAGPVLGWATLTGHGRGNWDDREQRAFEYGAGLGLRIERAFGRIGLWLEWRTNLWRERQQADITDSDAHATLPNFDMMASLGGSVTVLP
jgi:hypothetical protein